MFSIKRGFVVAAVIAVVTGGVVIAQQTAAPRGSHDWAPSVPLGKHHTLAATLDTVQLGWPLLVIGAGGFYFLSAETLTSTG